MGVFDLGSYGADIVLNSEGFITQMGQAEQQLTSFDQKTNTFASTLGTIAGGAILGLGAAIGGMTVAGVMAADDLNKALNGLQASTGSTDLEMKGMEESLKNIYNNNFGESFDDIAQSMANVKQVTGLAGAELESMTQNALMMRDAFELDVNESIGAANQLMKDLGVSSEEAYTLIAQMAQNGANKNGDLLDLISEYTPKFKEVGLSAEDMSNILISGVENGVNSLDFLADGFKEFQILATDGNETTRQAFQDLGFDANETANIISEGGEKGRQRFSELMQKLNEMPEGLEKTQLGVSLLGTKYEDMGSSAITSFANISDKADMTANTLQKINEIKYNTFGEAMSGIGRNMQTAMIEPIQEYVLPLLADFSQWIMDHMPQIKSAISTTFVVVGSIISTTVDVFKGLMSVFSDTESSTNSSFSSIQSIISNVIEAVKSIISDFVLLATDIWKKYGDDITAFAQTTWQNISQVISGVLDVIKGIIKTVTSLIRGDWEGVWNGIQEIVKGAWNAIEGVVKQSLNAVQAIIKGAGTVLKNIGTAIFNMLWEGIKYVWNQISTWTSTSFSSMTTTISNFGSSFLSAGKSIFNNLWSGLKSVWNSISSWVEDKVDWLLDKLDFWNSSQSKMSASNTGDGQSVNVPKYAVGTPYVPNDQLALIHKGEAIIPAKYNPFNNANTVKTTMNQNPINNTFSPTVNVTVNGGLGSKSELDAFAKKITNPVMDELLRKMKPYGFI